MIYTKAVFKKVAVFTGKHLESLFNKVAGQRTPILKNICERLLLLNWCINLGY